MNAKSRQSRLPRHDAKSEPESPLYKFSELDLLRFSEPRFKPESFLRSILTSDSPDFVRHFYNVLSGEYKLAINELQRSVYSNLSDFILVSREISRFESDLTTLRNLLNEVKAAGASQEPAKLVELEVCVDENAVGAHSNTNRDIKENELISEKMHELDLQIALCQYEQAVESILHVKELIKQQESQNQCTLAVVRLEVEACVQKLADYVCLELNNTILSKRHIAENIKWMSKLGLMDEAIDTFFNARGNLIVKKSKQIRFYGDIVHYMSDLSYMTVFIIKNTFEWYKYAHALASVTACLSKFVIWAQKEMEKLSASFIVHVFEIRNPIETIRECASVVLGNIETLSDIGMNLCALFEIAIQKHMKTALSRNVSLASQSPELSESSHHA